MNKGVIGQIIDRARQQKPNKEGIRISRWAVITNDPSMKEYVPHSRQKIFFDDVELELVYFNPDSDDDLAKLRTMEFTSVWIDGTSHPNGLMVRECGERIGRYPSVQQGSPQNWEMIIGYSRK